MTHGFKNGRVIAQQGTVKAGNGNNGTITGGITDTPSGPPLFYPDR